MYELRSRVEVEEADGVQGVVIRLMCSNAFLKKIAGISDSNKKNRPWEVTWYHSGYDKEKIGVYECYPKGYFDDQRFDGFYRTPYAKGNTEIYPHESLKKITNKS